MLTDTQRQVNKPKNLFLTGRPGIGKTTLLVKIADHLSGIRLGGFFTSEIRDANQRVGFRLETFSGTSGLLAHVTHGNGPRVGKYVVDLAAFEKLGVTALEEAIRTADVILVDEIGKMELFSNRFRAAVVQALDSSKPVVATVMAYGDRFVDTLKRRPDVRLIEVTPSNRDLLTEQLTSELSILIS